MSAIPFRAEFMDKPFYGISFMITPPRLKMNAKRDKKRYPSLTDISLLNSI